MIGASSLRDVLGECLCEAGRSEPNLVVLDADLSRSTKTAAFAAEFPERFIDVGIAEQNLIGVAAGLALGGKIPVAATFSVFYSRCLDQVRQSIAYTGLNVKLVGTHSGVSNGKDGATHHALFDLACFRALPGIAIINPGDPLELRQLFPQILNYRGPCYLRVTREALPPQAGPEAVLGKGRVLKEGSDAVICATGMMVSRSIQAAGDLDILGISTGVISFHTLRPFDEDLLITHLRSRRAVVTAEDHNSAGGLGCLVSELVGRTKPVPVVRVSSGDALGDTGTADEIYQALGLTSEAIVDAVLRALKIR